MTTSTSPIGIHGENFTPKLENWLRSLVVRPGSFLGFDSGVCRAVKVIDPGIVTFYRRYVADQGAYMRQGAAGGERFVSECPDLNGVDYFTGLNESTSDDPQSIVQTSDFYIGFAAACQARGVYPAGPNTSVGGPPDAHVHLLAPGVDAILAAGGLVTGHGYGPRHLHTAAEWLLHRAPMRWPQWGVSVPFGRIAYTECGHDDVGTVNGDPSGPWRELVRRGLLTIEGEQAELAALAASCASLGVRHALLFAFAGGETWRDYDYLESPPMRDWLAGHWATHIGPPEPPPPPPPPAWPRRVQVWPGANYGAAWLRNSRDMQDRMVTLPRGQVVTATERVDGWLRVEAWIPEALTREV
jgi:hypothetical protein